MGYVFDAMNRSGGDPDDERHHDATSDAYPIEPQTPSPPPQPPEPEERLSIASITKGMAPEDPTPAGDCDDAALSYAAPLDEPVPMNSANGDSGEVQPTPLRISGNERTRPGVDDRLVVLDAPGGVIAEEYRAIRTGLLARWHHKRHLVHTITSATPQEGKTITSLNLGLTFSELHNRRTVVVEADLRLPQFRKLLALADQPGLVHVLRGEAEMKDVVQRIEETGLDVIPAGTRANNDAVQLLSSNNMSRLLKMLRRNYDHVIVDTPPVVELADAGILGAQSDDVLMIVRMERTPRGLVDQAIRTLESYNAPVAGLVATDQKRYRGRYYYYRYGYKYGYRYRYYDSDRKAA
jgi:capsular exopolysaccharide synthesis family protein